MKKCIIKLMTAGLVGIMAFSMVGCSDDSSSDKKSKKDKKDRDEKEKIEIEFEEGEPTFTTAESDEDAPDTSGNLGSSFIPIDCEIGDTITFGNYGGEDITWLVLDKEDGKYLVISEYALDCKAYNDEFVDATWETCTLRSWLNDDFYNEAFLSSEQNYIVTTTVTADSNPEYDTNPGNDTQDKVFLLSIDELNTYFDSEEARICYPTDYAIDNGVNVKNNACWWWLRSPGVSRCIAVDVLDGGYVYSHGDSVNVDNIGVRPALWLSVE